MTRHNDTSEALAPLAAELLQIAKSSWSGYDAWASDETMLYFDSPTKPVFCSWVSRPIESVASPQCRQSTT
jgi:hypothetical protein